MSTIAAVMIGLPEPKRRPLSLEAIQSVYDQTREPDDFIFGQDYSRMGEVENMNRLLDATSCDFLAFLHDDDVWLPRHLAIAELHMGAADVIVSRYELVGRPVSSIEPWHQDFADLEITNWIGSPSMVVARRSVFKEWTKPCGTHRWVDWCNWVRMWRVGAVFRDTKTVTVKYRFGPWSNGSWRG